MTIGVEVTQAGFSWIAPVKIDKNGPAYLKSDVFKLCVRNIAADNYFYRKAKDMTSDTQKAIEKIDQVMQAFTETLDKFLDVEKHFAEQSKRASGTVREAGERLAQGLAKVEKAANFDRLERYVGLLERAASAMTILAELEKTGKLEKIAGAIR